MPWYTLKTFLSILEASNKVKISNASFESSNKSKNLLISDKYDLEFCLGSFSLLESFIIFGDLKSQIRDLKSIKEEDFLLKLNSKLPNSTWPVWCVAITLYHAKLSFFELNLFIVCGRKIVVPSVVAKLESNQPICFSTSFSDDWISSSYPDRAAQ